MKEEILCYTRYMNFSNLLEDSNVILSLPRKYNLKFQIAGNDGKKRRKRRELTYATRLISSISRRGVVLIIAW